MRIKFDISKFFTTSGKCFPLKFFRKTISWKPSQIFPLLESVFHWPTFLLANKHKKVWKVLSRKPLFGKQTQLKGKHFPENQVKFFFDWNWLESVFRWLECIFRWLESVFRWPESVFRWPTFLITNKHMKVWKMVSQKLLSGKQTRPEFLFLC